MTVEDKKTIHKVNSIIINTDTGTLVVALCGDASISFTTSYETFNTKEKFSTTKEIKIDAEYENSVWLGI